jgi:hypothetical protein
MASSRHVRAAHHRGRIDLLGTDALIDILARLAARLCVTVRARPAA